MKVMADLQSNNSVNGNIAAKNGHKNITHVILDFDGLLVDTERLYSKANSEIMANFGQEFTPELKGKMMGRKKTEAVEVLLNESGLAPTVTVDQYMAPYDVKIEQIMKDAEPLPGADELINHLHSSKIPLAICTGSDSEEFRQKTANPKIKRWIDMIPLRVLCGSDPEVKHGKPHPEPYHVTMRRFSQPPASAENVLVFEDSINGAMSAALAGCTVIMVPQLDQLPKDWDEAGMRDKVDDILESLTQFNPFDYGLPPFPRQMKN